MRLRPDKTRTHQWAVSRGKNGSPISDNWYCTHCRVHGGYGDSPVTELTSTCEDWRTALLVDARKAAFAQCSTCHAVREDHQPSGGKCLYDPTAFEPAVCETCLRTVNFNAVYVCECTYAQAVRRVCDEEA